MKLTRDFYNRNTLTVARELLGKHLVHITERGALRGVIVETEAYAGRYDKASHTFQNRLTERSAIWYGEGGYSYVYQIYGIYFCLGIISEERHLPGAVLIRAVEPVEGIETMTDNRIRKSKKEQVLSFEQICNGPSRVCIAMNIDKKCNHLDLCGDELFIEDMGGMVSISDVGFSPRINIDYAGEAALHHWRYFLQGNNHISVKKYEPLRSWRMKGYPSLRVSPEPDLFTYDYSQNKQQLPLNQMQNQKMLELPKIELHLHLEGAISIETLLKLASQNKTRLPEHIVKQRSIYFDTFDEFVHMYYSICNAIAKESDFSFLISDVIDYVQRNNIIYAEVSWTPFLYLNRGLDFSRIMSIMNNELENRGFRNRINFIIDTQRDHGLEVAELVYSKTFSCRDSNIVGIGLTGQEEGFSPSIYKNLYETAKEKGFGCTAHAGEYGSASDVWQCVRDLGVTRIGHGIRASGDSSLMNYLVDNNIHLELCPTSNVRLRRTFSFSDHPLLDFWRRGVNFGINTDDPGVFAMELTSEYINVMSILGLSMANIKKSVIDSIDASFASQEKKIHLRNYILNAWREEC